MAEKFPTYPRYRDSDVLWIGKHPDHWALTRVKFESYVKARVGWHGLKSDDFTEEGPYLVTGTDFKGPEIEWTNCYHCDLERYKQDPYIQLKNGDLLITKDGTIGKVALVNNLDGEATLNSGVFVVRPLARNYTSRFYFWLLQSSAFTGFVDFNKTGSTILHLYQDTFVNFKFAMPVYSEQHKIASFLDHETTKIDTLIEKQQQLIKLLKEKRQAVISHAVTKGLNPNAPMRDSGVEWLGEVPAHWDVLPLKRVASMQGGYAFSSEDFRTEGIQLLRIGNVYLNRLALERQPTFLPEEFLGAHADFVVGKGDILMSLTGTLGKTDYGYAIKIDEEGPFLLNQRVGKLTPNGSRVEPSYLIHSIRSDSYLTQLYSLPSGTKQANLSNEDVLNIKVALPNDLEEQRLIANFIDEHASKVDSTIARAIRLVELMQERRTALISAAVTGKIDVRDWQPANHPNASVEETAS